MVGPLVDLQNVHHSLPRTGYGGAHKVRIGCRRDAPALFQPKPAPLENGGLSSFFSASCAPSPGGCRQLSRTPPAGPPATAASSGPGLPAVPHRPTQSEPAPYWIRGGLPPRHPVSWAGGVVAPCAPGPLRFLPPRNGGAPFPPWRWRSGGTGQSLRPSSLRLAQIHRSAAEPALVKTGDARMGLPVRRRPPAGNQGPQFLLLFLGQLDTVFLSRHDASPWTNSPMPAEYTSRALIQRRWTTKLKPR